MVAAQLPEAEAVISHSVSDMNAHRVELLHTDTPKHLPQFQTENWQVARTAYNFLQQRDTLPELSPEHYEDVSHQTPPGRYETYTFGDKTVILDGAHNPQKLIALQASLPPSFQSGSLWLAALVDADDTRIEQCGKVLAGIDAEFICTEFRVGQDIRGRKSISSVSLAAMLAGRTSIKIQDPILALESALNAPQKHIVVTGSLYLVAQLRPYLAQQATPLVQ